MFHWDDPLIIVSLILQVGVIAFLLQGAFRKYPLVLAYSLTRLITSVLEVAIRQKLGNRTAFFRQVYYSDRVILNLLLFAMVTAIMFRLLAGKTPAFDDRQDAHGNRRGGLVIALPGAFAPLYDSLAERDEPVSVLRQRHHDPGALDSADEIETSAIHSS